MFSRRIISLYHIHNPCPPHHRWTAKSLQRPSLSLAHAMRKTRGPNRLLAFQQFLNEKYESPSLNSRE